MKIETKNVKFGDCNLIIGSTETLLIDCGSKNKDNTKKLSCAQFAYTQIENYINSNSIQNLMISHFDTDHFNGILEIPDNYKFETTFLPYCIINKHSIFTQHIALLLAIAPKGAWGFNLSKKIVELFLKLPKISNEILFLKRADKIKYEKNHIRILWPDITFFNIRSTLSEEDISILEKTYNQKLINATKEFIEIFDSYIYNLYEIKPSSQLDFSAPENLINALNNLIYISDEFKKSDTYISKKENFKSFYIKKYHELITCMNALSIVCDYEDRFIFLGDAPKDIIKHIKCSFKSKYTVAKIQHHATAKYYTHYTPSAEKYIVSNGGYPKWEIDNIFLNFNAEFICTQKNEFSKTCKYYTIHKTCSTKCIDCQKPISC